jgi:hypothetical protein
MANANATFDSLSVTPIPNGQRLITGFVSIGTYDSSNMSFDLSNYLLAAGIPTIRIGSSVGYSFDFSGTAASGRIRAWQLNMSNVNSPTAGIINCPLLEVGNAKVLTTNSAFIAIGKAA